MADWKDTLNLPRTTFPMKANLQTAEPEMIAWWDEIDLYARIGESRSGRPRFVLHDGPPVREWPDSPRDRAQQDPEGFRRQVAKHGRLRPPYVPGYDCHGLPIELKVDRELGPKKRDMPIADVRRACRGTPSGSSE